MQYLMVVLTKENLKKSLKEEEDIGMVFLQQLSLIIKQTLFLNIALLIKKKQRETFLKYTKPMRL